MKLQEEHSNQDVMNVAPLVGAWIEIPEDIAKRIKQKSVAPLVGAWIEIFEPGETDADEACRSSRGSVD